MDKRLMPAGDEVDSGATDWRSVLRRLAEEIRQGRGGLDAAGKQVLGEALGPLADDAFKIVEAYARGAAQSPASKQLPAEFGNRLVIILNGIEASLDS